MNWFFWRKPKPRRTLVEDAHDFIRELEYGPWDYPKPHYESSWPNMRIPEWREYVLAQAGGKFVTLGKEISYWP